MNILIVEDDQNKLKNLSDFIGGLDYLGATVTSQRSYQSGLKAIMEIDFDLVLLDMSLPTFEISPNEPGGRSRAYAGLEIIKQMERNKMVLPVIVVTQFERFGEGTQKRTLDEIREELTTRKSLGVFKGLVYYNAALSDWKLNLEKILNELCMR